jgi:ABC-2 type transport system ATP-binding protein
MELEETLKVESLSVEINDKDILKGISFCINKGEICALVGHNGAGKSVTIKSILGLQQKRNGQIKIKNLSIDQNLESYKKQFTYIPEEPLLFSELTVEQHFQLYGTSYNVSERVFQERLEYYLNAFELEDKLIEYPQNLSKGMRQKVNIISNFIVESPLMIIDEPFIGLDVEASNFLVQELLRRKARGVSVLITSHQIDKIKRFCDSFVMLKNGEVVQKGAINKLGHIERRLKNE